MVLSAWRGQHSQGTTSIGRGLYVERLTAGSTAAARKCLLITCKIIIPPPDSWDPPDGPPYFVKKTFPPNCWDPPATSSHARKCVRAKKMIRPLTAGTHELHLRMQGSASGKKMILPPDCWDPPATCSHARKCIRAKKLFATLTAGTHHLHLRTQGSASGQKNRFAPLTAGMHQLHLRRQGSA